MFDRRKYPGRARKLPVRLPAPLGRPAPSPRQDTRPPGVEADAAESPPGAAALQFRRILVPLDFTERSRRLLHLAAEIARRSGGELVLMHVYERYEYASACCSLDSFEATNDRLQCLALQDLENFRSSIGDDPAIRAARLVVAPGYLEVAVADAAKNSGADLILVTTHGRRGLQRLFLGSKAELIARHASCPVMIVPAKT